MRLLDIFSGIGGFSLAAQWVWGDELEIVAFCEIDKFCQKVLKKHWPNVTIIEDVRDVTKDIIAYHEKQIDGGNIRKENEGQIQEFGNGAISRIDLLTGGFPCQPFSCAGKRKGKEDNRFLWPEMLRVIKEFKPRWIIAENVAGIVRMALDDCLSNLEGEGYSTQAIIIPACAVNAPHRRDRVWIVAYAEQSCGRGGISKQMPDGEWGTSEEESKSLQSEIRKAYRSDIKQGSQDVADIHNEGLSAQWEQGRIREEKRETCHGIERTNLLGTERDSNWWLSEPNVGRVAHGIPSRVDRLKSLGNAIVPQVAEQIFRAIKEIDEEFAR